MTPFTDMPKSTLRVQLPGFSNLCAALSGCVLLQVWSFVWKAELLKFILLHCIMTWRMWLCLTPLHKIC